LMVKKREQSHSGNDLFCTIYQITSSGKMFNYKLYVHGVFFPAAVASLMR
jgi:hypothetical protein